MFKMTFILSAVIYGAFVIWGNPQDEFAELAEDEPILTILSAQAAQSYDQPTILGANQQLAAVTRDIRSAPEAPDPYLVAASAPAAGFEDPGRIGQPVVVSLVHDSLLDPVEQPLTTDTVIEDVVTVPTDTPRMRVTGSRVNMRSGPSTANGVVDSLPEGTIAEVLGDPIDGWLQIRDVSTGTVGFMSAAFLEPA